MDTNTDARTIDAYHQRNGTNRVPPLPAKPTAAMPGTLEKLAVMESRVCRGEQVFHPDDARDTFGSKGIPATDTLKGADEVWQEIKKAMKKERYRKQRIARYQAAATRATTTA